MAYFAKKHAKMCFSYIYKHKFAAKLLNFFDTTKFFRLFISKT